MTFSPSTNQNDILRKRTRNKFNFVRQAMTYARSWFPLKTKRMKFFFFFDVNCRKKKPAEKILLHQNGRKANLKIRKVPNDEFTLITPSISLSTRKSFHDDAVFSCQRTRFVALSMSFKTIKLICWSSTSIALLIFTNSIVSPFHFSTRKSNSQNRNSNEFRSYAESNGDKDEILLSMSKTRRSLKLST